MAARPRTYLIQVGNYDISIDPRHLSVLPTAAFHPCCRRDDGCCLLPLIIWKPSARSSLYSSASGRIRFLVPPSGTTCLSTSHLRRHSRFSDNDFLYLSVFPFLPRHYHMTCVLLLPFITTVWTPVVLAIIYII